MKATKEVYRQGDVMLVKVARIPGGAKPVARDRGRVVLAYGEVTGHAHAILEEEVTMLEVDSGIRYLDAAMDAFLRHEEHGAIFVPGGKYRVIRQREYTPEEIRNVAD